MAGYTFSDFIVSMKNVEKSEGLHWAIRSVKSMSEWGDILLIITIDTHASCDYFVDRCRYIRTHAFCLISPDARGRVGTYYRLATDAIELLNFNLVFYGIHYSIISYKLLLYVVHKLFKKTIYYFFFFFVNGLVIIFSRFASGKCPINIYYIYLLSIYPNV